MIISDKLLTELVSLDENIHSIIQNKNVNDLQIEAFLRNLEKRRYNILTQIKLYNKTVEYKTEQIKNISDEYKAKVIDGSLKIYIPEPMPSYKNIKTHAFKNILLNITEIAKPYSNMFSDKVFILITIYDNIKGWDIDNKFIKPISDALIASGVIQDDNIDKMFYAVKGEYSENPHTEVCITSVKNSIKIIENYVS
jgi:Holliday junction resolvase RusA-like endonuclease